MLALQGLGLGQRRLFGGAQHGGQGRIEELGVAAPCQLGQRPAQKGGHRFVGMHETSAVGILDGEHVAPARQQEWQQPGQQPIQLVTGQRHLGKGVELEGHDSVGYLCLAFRQLHQSAACA